MYKGDYIAFYMLFLNNRFTKCLLDLYNLDNSDVNHRTLIYAVIIL